SRSDPVGAVSDHAQEPVAEDGARSDGADGIQTARVSAEARVRGRRRWREMAHVQGAAGAADIRQSRSAGDPDGVRQAALLSDVLDIAANHLADGDHAAAQHRRTCRRAGQQRRVSQCAHDLCKCVRAGASRALLGELSRRSSFDDVCAVLQPAQAARAASGKRFRAEDGNTARLSGGAFDGVLQTRTAARLNDPAQFIRDNTELIAPPLVPEIRLHLATEVVPLWRKTEEELEEMGVPPPYWAFAWAGGQALSRYILDNPQEVAGKRVL